MRALFLPTCLIAVLGVLLTAQAPAPGAEELAALKKEYQTALRAFDKAYRQAQTDAERKQVIQEKYPRAAAYAGRFVALAQKHAGTVTAFEALAWVVRKALSGDAFREALRILARDFAADPKIESVVRRLGRFTLSEEARALLEAVHRQNRDPRVKLRAQYAMGDFFLGAAEMARALARDPRREEGLRRYGGEEFLALLRRHKPTELEAEAARWFRAVAAAPAAKEIHHSRHKTLAGAAERALFEVEHLTVGKVAPEIEGEDLDGRPMKLSDFRGKVVVLDFWGFW